MTDAIRDGNHVPVALGVSSADATVALPFTINASTGKLAMNGVTSFNGLTGDVILAAGTGISLTPAGNTITIANTAAGLTIGTTAITGGTSGRILFDLAGVVSEDADLTFVTDTLTATKIAASTSITLGSKITNYNSIATTGQGVPSIYGTGRLTAQTAAVASVATYTVGAADGSFYISANVLITTATVHSFTATVTYTDEGNTSRTVTLQFSTVAGAFVTAMTNAQGTVPYEGVPLHIRAKATTAITIATTGTFTTVVYNVEGSITQIA